MLSLTSLSTRIKAHNCWHIRNPCREIWPDFVLRSCSIAESWVAWGKAVWSLCVPEDIIQPAPSIPLLSLLTYATVVSLQHLCHLPSIIVSLVSIHLSHWIESPGDRLMHFVHLHCLAQCSALCRWSIRGRNLVLFKRHLRICAQHFWILRHFIKCLQILLDTDSIDTAFSVTHRKYKCFLKKLTEKKEGKEIKTSWNYWFKLEVIFFKVTLWTCNGWKNRNLGRLVTCPK